MNAAIISSTMHMPMSLNKSLGKF